jgi:hypothetical protein
MDGFVDRDAAFLDQHHEGDRRDRLGHRIDAENRIVLDRDLALDIGKALDGGMDDLAAPVDQKLCSREASGIEVALLEVIFETIERRLGHSGLFGRGGGGG